MKQVSIKKYDVIVVGGGASGLMAAITASRQGAKVVVIDHLNRIGKKILSTGNGKCNYTNLEQGISNYRGNDPAFVLPIFSQFNEKDTL
ncbi:MAG: NAD(P)/FAD-dependent oxidoreductase, partial [Lachnospiraceae bacterium]